MKRACPGLGIFPFALLVLSSGREAFPEEAKADASNGTAPLAGHSYHGEAFNEGPRQKAYIMEGTGKVDFPITTGAPLAQTFFNQGVGQLHGFWYFEAERSFRQVAALDPGCAMAYWGMAMANVHNDKRAKSFIQKAVERKAGTTPREALWIDGLAAYYASSAEEKARRRDYVRCLERIVQENPGDIEAKAFLVLQIWMNSFEWPIPSHQAVDALLAQVFAVEPMHPAHHYAIHLWDGEKAERALVSAASSGQSSPGIAHMWHMGGHIFADLHRYADSAWQQEASARVDHAHMIRDHVLPDQIHNYSHNNEWLIRNLSYIGRVRDAIALAKNMLELPRHPLYNTLEKGGSSSSFGRARLLEVLSLFELWEELIALKNTLYIEPTEIEGEKVKALRVLGTAYFSTGDLERGRGQIIELEALLKKARDARQAAAEEAEKKARAASQPDDKVLKAMSDAMQPFFDRLRPMETALSDLKGRQAMAQGDPAAAFAELDKVKDLRKEILSLLHLRAENQEKAEELARQAADEGKDQVYPLANYVHVLEACGKGEKAREAFSQLRALAGRADLDVPVFQRLEPLAKALGYPADWRLPPPGPKDVGLRPDLDTLGPFRWHPPAVSDWTLPDSRGQQVSLADYRGKPVVLIFFLGSGCLHCVEQLNEFAPMAGEFRKAGMSLAAISSEYDDLKFFPAFTPRNQDEWPFPILADKEAAVFKAYRAFDDFENMPLHGTFLVDGEGRMLWQDISFQPFTQARFVLEEGKRLLQLHGGPPAALTLAGGGDEKEAAAKETAAADTFPIADGPPAELLKLIDKLRPAEAASTSGQGQERDFERAQRTIVKAAEKILALKPDEVTRAAAAKAKLESSILLVRIGDRGALGAIEKSIDEMKGAERSKLAEETARQVLSSVKVYLAAGKLGPRHVDVAQSAARWIEACGGPALAAEAYREFGELLSRSETKSLALEGKRLQGAARRLSLGGQPAEIGGTLFDGTQVSRSEYEGKVTLVAFWATWQKQSVSELENLRAVHERWQDRGLKILGISLDRNKETLASYLKGRSLPWDTLFSDDLQATGWNHPMAIQYGVKELPAFILVGKDGRIVKSAAGFKGLGEEMEKLLGPGIDPKRARL